MEEMVIKNAIVIAVILFWSCGRDDKNRVKASLLAGCMYIIMNCLSIQVQKKFYAVGILLCVLEAFFVRLLICLHLTKNKEKTYIKQFFYYYVYLGSLHVLEYAYSIIVGKAWIEVGTLMEAMLIFDDYWSTVIVLIVCYILMRIDIFEFIPYGISRLIISGMVIFECTVAFFMCLGKMLPEYQKEAYKISTLCICAMAVIVVLFKKKKVEYENEVFQNMIDTEYYTYEKIYYREQAIKNIRHNLANHIQIMEELSKQGKNRDEVEYRNELITDYNMYFCNEVEDRKKEAEKIQKKNDFTKYIYVILPSSLLVTTFFNYYTRADSIVHWINVGAFIFITSLFIYFVLIIILKQKNSHKMKSMIDEGRKSEEKWDNIKNKIENSVFMENEQGMTSENIGELVKLVKSIDKKHGDNDVVNVMLNYKENRCLEQGIKTRWSINIPPYEAVKKVDIVELLGNLIDNAIEACIRMPDGDKFIKIDTYFRANFWILKIENSKREDEKPVKTKFKTQKNGEHGQGMRIIKLIINRYDGLLKYEDKGKSFKIELMLTIEKKN